MPDEDLAAIERILGGQIQDYAVLVGKYQVRIRGYCRGVLGNTVEAEDAAQEIFIKAYQGLAKFRKASGFSTWLYRIAVNHCRDLLRRKSRDRTESWETLREQAGESFEAQVTGDQTLAWKEQVRESLERLPEQYKTILLLREVQGLSYEELADLLGCSIDAVKGRLQRARHELEVQFKERV